MLPAAGNSGRNGRGVIVGFLQQYQITTGFPPGNKSSGMAACTSGYAAATATAAAGEVMEGADRFIISPAGALWFGNITGRGGVKVWSKW